MAALQYTPVDDIPKIHARLKETFKTGVTRPLAWRKHQIKQLALMFQENMDAIERAIYEDSARPSVQAMAGEIVAVVRACAFALERIDQWVKPENPVVDPIRGSWNVDVYPSPKGTVLLMTPWNGPWVVTFGPFIGALAAGCTAVIKPSELSPSSSALMAELLPKYLDPTAYAIVNGAVAETQALLDLRWDHILFTGSTTVGRVIAQAAARHLTPVTLELGGKSAVVVDSTCDIALAAKRVLWGKTQVGGQVCVAPDHVLVVRSVYEPFLEELRKLFQTWWPNGALHPDLQWARVPNEKHFRRIKTMLDTSKGRIFLGGESNEKALKIGPTVVTDVGPDDSLMKEEIFGPILPVIAVDTIQDAVRYLAERPKPLVLYAFTKSQETKDLLLSSTDSGTLQFNDTLTLLQAYELPFGGRGDSGHGAHRGKNSFDTFTHRRASLDIPPEVETAFAIRYPPYTKEAYERFKSIGLLKMPE